MKVLASFIHVDIPHYTLPSGERIAAFERVLEIPPGEADKLSNAMKYYKKMGYIRAHRRLYGLVKKYHHKDKVHSIATCTCTCTCMSLWMHVHLYMYMYGGPVVRLILVHMGIHVYINKDYV